MSAQMRARSTFGRVKPCDVTASIPIGRSDRAGHLDGSRASRPRMLRDKHDHNSRTATTHQIGSLLSAQQWWSRWSCLAWSGPPNIIGGFCLPASQQAFLLMATGTPQGRLFHLFAPLDPPYRRRRGAEKLRSYGNSRLRLAEGHALDKQPQREWDFERRHRDEYHPGYDGAAQHVRELQRQPDHPRD